MIKQVALFQRKPGMDREAFKSHYEGTHVPLVMSEGGRFLADYRRNYVSPEGTFSAGHATATPPPAIDVITEVWFDAPADLDRLAAAFATPAIGKRIADDEAKFLDRSKMTVFLVEECNTSLHKLPSRPVGETPPIKMIALLKKKKNMQREAFKDYYESRHEPLARELFPQIAGYRRSYIIPESTYVYPHIKDVPPPPDFDVMTELWFNSMEDFEAMGQATGRPEIGERLARDEENLFDRSVMTMLLVDERVTPSHQLRTARAS